MEGRPKIIVISGPTASGKTALAIELAQTFQGEIINADCMQVYRGMDIGTAKPKDIERQRIPHHLFDIRDPDEPMSAGTYGRIARECVVEISSRGKIPFVVGGTGLYIRALLKGLIAVELDEEERNRLRQSLGDKPAHELYKRLLELDPEAARTIHPNDRVRIIRALEIVSITGRKASELRSSHGFRGENLSALRFFLAEERNKLYEKIDKRCDQMLLDGLLEETKRLLEAGYGPHLNSMRSIGYRHMAAHIVMGKPLEVCVSEFKRDTKRYAKRQYTWFKKEEGFIWIAPEKKDMIIQKIREFIEGDD